MAVLPKQTLFSLLPDDVRDVVFAKHRLQEDLRFQDKSQTQDFVKDCGIVSLFAGTELPSIQEAIAGEIVANTGNERYGSGFGIAWIWSKDLPDEGHCAYGSFFREKATLIAQQHWPALVTLGHIDHQKARKNKHLSTTAYQMASYIEANGPTQSDVLRKALKYSGREGSSAFRKVLRELERHWTIVAIRRGEHVGGADMHTWELTSRWLPDGVDKTAEKMTYQEAMGRLLVASIDAALVVEEQNIARWFGWTRSLTTRVINRLLDEEHIHRVGGQKPLLISSTLLDTWPSA